MAKIWMVFCTAEDPLNARPASAARSKCFDDEKTASDYYAELLKQGPPPGAEWLDVYLEYRERSDGPPRVVHSITKNAYLKRNADGSISTLTSAEIVQV